MKLNWLTIFVVYVFSVDIGLAAVNFLGWEAWTVFPITALVTYIFNTFGHPLVTIKGKKPGSQT